MTSTNKSTYEQSQTYNIQYQTLDTLAIQFFNKVQGDTIVENGAIVEDLVVIITNIVVDGIRLTDKMDKIFVYADNNGKIHLTHGYMHVAGTMLMTVNRNILYMDWINCFSQNVVDN